LGMNRFKAGQSGRKTGGSNISGAANTDNY